VRIKTFNSIDELHDLVPDWEHLVGNAIEQNINYEPVPLISLLSNIDYPGWFVVCIWTDNELSGFFPMQTAKRLPLPIMQFSTLYRYHFLSCIPLVHKDHKEDTLIAFWDWVNRSKKSKIYYFSELLSTSKLGNEMLELGKRCGARIECSVTTDRAIGDTTGDNFDAYLRNTLSAKSRSSTRNKLRKLDKLGGLQLRFTTETDELKHQLDYLIQVEGTGWKREKGSAIAMHPGLKQFMLDTALYAASQDRIILTTGFVGDQPVTGVYGLINDGKLVIYKIGYDENYARYSVGQNTILGLIEHVMLNTSIHTFDSCTISTSQMYNRCLPDRQAVFEYQIASNHVFSKLCVLAVAKSRTIRLGIKKAVSRTQTAE